MYLIDGYNLSHAIGVPRDALLGAVEAFCRRGNQSARIVFDPALPDFITVSTPAQTVAAGGMVTVTATFLRNPGRGLVRLVAHRSSCRSATAEIGARASPLPVSPLLHWISRSMVTG